MVCFNLFVLEKVSIFPCYDCSKTPFCGKNRGVNINIIDDLHCLTNMYCEVLGNVCKIK